MRVFEEVIMDPARNRVGGHHEAALAAIPHSPSSESSLVRRIGRLVLLRFQSEPVSVSHVHSDFETGSDLESGRTYSAPQITQWSPVENYSISGLCQTIERELIEQVETFVQDRKNIDFKLLFDNYYIRHGFLLLRNLIQEVEEDFVGSKLTYNDRAEKAEFLGRVGLILNSQDTVGKKLIRLAGLKPDLSKMPALVRLSIVADCITQLCSLRTSYELLLTAIYLYKTESPFRYYGSSYPSIELILNKCACLTFDTDFLLVDPEQVSRSVNPSGTLLPGQILVDTTDILDRYRSSSAENVKIDRSMMDLFYLALFQEIAKIIPLEHRIKWYPSNEIMSPAIRGYFEKNPSLDVSFKMDLHEYFGLFPLLRILPLFSVNCMSTAKLLQSTIFQPLRDCREFLLRNRGERSIQFLWNSDACCLECIREWEEGIYLRPEMDRPEEKLLAYTVGMCKIQLPLNAEVKAEFQICEFKFAENTQIEEITELCKVLPECIKVASCYFY